MLTPRRALLHPAWLASLLILGLNDHVFKGANVLPATVTGKLSDFAGLFVAPALLCVLLRLRSRRAVTAAHVATALVFALVKTVPLATVAFERVLSLVTASHVWTDPSDLVALPMVLVAHRMLVPVMEAEVRDGWLSRLATVIGSVMCVATSSPMEPALTVHNGTARVLQVTIRSTSAKFESDVVHSKTPLPVNAALFDGAPTSLTLKPDAKLSSSGLPEFALVLIDDASGNVHQRLAVASKGAARNLEIGELPGGGLTLSSPDGAIDVRDLDESEACAMAPFAKTYSMSIPDVPYGRYTITSSTPTMDGCIALGFKEATTQGKVCLPDGVWPFQVGDELFGNSLEIAHDRDGVRTVVMVETRSSSKPLVSDQACAMVDACHAIAFTAALPLGDGTLIKAGEEHTYMQNERTVRTIAGALTHTVLTPMACDSFDDLGDHANYVTITTGPVPPPLDGGVEAGADADADASSDAGTD